jgi:putative ABC transport system permease protein
MALTVRSAADPLQLTPALRQALHETDPTQPFSRVTSMAQYLADAVGAPRLSALLLAGFGATALLLAAVGIYGVISFSVTRRTREIGIRIALGAARRDVLRMVVGQAVLLASLGVAVGIGGALLLTRTMQGMLFGVSASEPTAYASVSALLIAIAGLAAYIPARRAARISPAVALRCE